MALDMTMNSGPLEHQHDMRIRSSPVNNNPALSRSLIKSVETRRSENHAAIVAATASRGSVQQHGGTSTWSRSPGITHSTTTVLSKNSISVLQTRGGRSAARTHALTVTAATSPGALQHAGEILSSTWSKPDSMWHLVNLKTMKPVKNYEQLSRIMQNLGWSFYVTPQRDLWCTWGTCHQADVQHACLPYPDIGSATRAELNRFVRKLEYAGLVGILGVEAGELPAAASRLSEDIKAGNVQVSLAVKGTDRRIETFKDLAEALVGKGWRRVSDNHFYRFESSPVTPICHVISVIHLPLLRSFRQVCLEDLESIVRLTGSLFYLRFNNALTMDPATLSALQIHKKGVEGEEASSLDDVSGKKALTRDYLRLWSRITRMLKKYGTTITSNNSPSTLCIQLLPSHKSNGEEEATVKLQDVQSNKISKEELVGAAGSAGGGGGGGGGGGEYFVDHVKGKKDVGTSAASRVAVAIRHVWLSSSITRMVKKYSTITVRSSSSFCLQLTHHKNATAAAGGEEEANALESNKTNGVGILGPSAEEAEEKLVNEGQKGSE